MRRLMIWLMIAALLLSTVGLTGCSDDGQDVSESVPGENDDADNGTTAGNSKESKESKGLFMQVDKATGKMLIRRPEQETSATMGEKGSWTIFVYLCGTDLESPMFKGGSATDDIKEMKAAAADDRIRFVIQTGGTTFWHNGDMDEDMNQRFVIEGGKLIKVSEEERVSMGSPRHWLSFSSGALRISLRRRWALSCGITAAEASRESAGTSMTKIA